MNKRTNEIIKQLCSEKEWTIGQLAQLFSVSQRTIRNDLNLINDSLTEHALGTIQLGRGGRIICQEDFSRIWEHLSENDFYEYKLSKEERKQIASAMLVCTSGYITLSAIADELVVSRATVIHDLDEIKELIQSGNLQVISHPNKGLRVEGKESDKRVFLMQLGKVHFGQQKQDFVLEQLQVDEAVLNILEKILFEQEHVHQCFLNDVSFQKIVMYLGIMLNRNRQGAYMEERMAQENSKYDMAQDIIKYTCQYCSAATTEHEIRFLSELLSFAGYMKQKNSSRSAIKTQLAARKFIEYTSEVLKINLNNDFEFFENLSNHLESVFRSKKINDTENSIIDEILQEHQSAAEAVWQGRSLLEQCAGYELPDTELGYIAMHVCAAIERKKNRDTVFQVIFACHAGIGTSHLLMERLKKHFHFQIIDIVSAHEACRLKAEQADLIISTVPLKECEIHAVVVSPMLKDEDYIRIGTAIEQIRNDRHTLVRQRQRTLSARGLLEKITPVVWETAGENAPQVLRQLSVQIGEYFGETLEPEEEVFAPTLTQALSGGHIQSETECESWRQAIEKSAEKLLREGYIEKRYIDAMIENVLENGPYFIIAPGFAVPHAAVEEGCLRMGMNLIRLNHPVSFCVETEDSENPYDEEAYKVEFLCCFSAVDKKMHMKAFFHLVNMVRKPEFLTALRACRTESEMMAVICEYEMIAEMEEQN